MKLSVRTHLTFDAFFKVKQGIHRKDPFISLIVGPGCIECQNKLCKIKGCETFDEVTFDLCPLFQHPTE